MDFCVCYTRADGGLSVFHPADNARLVRHVRYTHPKTGQRHEYRGPSQRLQEVTGLWTIPADLQILDGETDNECAVRLAGKHVPVPAAQYKVRRRDSLPTDRTFRGAWEDDGTAIKVNMTKARVLHKAKLIRERDEKLKKLRDSVEDAEDRGDAARLVGLKVQRKRLRDLEAVLDAQLAAIATPEALKAFVPGELQ